MKKSAVPAPIRVSRSDSSDGCPDPPGFNSQSLAFRHLDTFRRVYEDGTYLGSRAGFGETIRTVRKSLRDVTMAFGSELFADAGEGSVLPTPFGERLFNDTRALDLAMGRLMEKVGETRDHGRILRVGTSPAIFRTSVFRSVFCELQSMDGFRLSYVQLGKEDYAKSLQQGLCDLYLGINENACERFASQFIADIPVREYQRGDPGSLQRKDLHSVIRQKPVGRGKRPGSAILIPEEKWIHWIDHPAACEEGVMVRAPEISVDPRFWNEVDSVSDGRETISLHAVFLKNHPFEFLPKLSSRLRERI